MSGRAASGRSGRSGRPGGPVRGREIVTSARGLAQEALVQVDGGARANVVVPRLLETSTLERRDRAFVVQLVYGTTRMQRACDFLLAPYVLGPLDAPTRAALRLGAFQMAFLDTPAHAAVSATVEVVAGRSRGLVNAVLRRVAHRLQTPVDWPDDATRLSYPDWIVERLVADLGSTDAQGALERMDESASATERDDGYIQDLASQWVAEVVGATAGERVLDLCAAPGGKATAMASAGAEVVALDVAAARIGRVAANIAELGLLGRVLPVVGDGLAAPFAPGRFDRVLVDAPCSGLGVLRRRPDARWRVEPSALERLAALQRQLLAAAAELVRPGGRLVYSVCTLTAAETVDVDGWLAATHPELRAEPPPSGPWRPHGRGALLLPQAADTDGMFVLALRRPD